MNLVRATLIFIASFLLIPSAFATTQKTWSRQDLIEKLQSWQTQIHSNPLSVKENLRQQEWTYRLHFYLDRKATDTLTDDWFVEVLQQEIRIENRQGNIQQLQYLSQLLDLFINAKEKIENPMTFIQQVTNELLQKTEGTQALKDSTSAVIEKRSYFGRHEAQAAEPADLIRASEIADLIENPQFFLPDFIDPKLLSEYLEIPTFHIAPTPDHIPNSLSLQRAKLDPSAQNH